jgi:antitoxin component YwqK of YwqJK toxin-antitoxin module
MLSFILFHCPQLLNALEQLSVERDSEGRILSSEYQDNEGNIRRTVNTYGPTQLLSSLISINETPYARDSYFYTRAGSLRRLEREYLAEDAYEKLKLVFPGFSSTLEMGKDFISPQLVETSPFIEEIKPPVEKSVFNTDAMGKVLTESDYNEEGLLVGLMENTWEDGRLLSYKYTAYTGDTESVSLVEYSYNEEGERIKEDNYRNGVLERSLYRAEDGLQIEDIYMNGVVILRATYKDGRKISEERIR